MGIVRNVPVTLAGKVILHDFLVLAKFNYPIVVGMDFLVKSRFSIDFERQSLETNDQHLNFKFTRTATGQDTKLVSTIESNLLTLDPAQIGIQEWQPAVTALVGRYKSLFAESLSEVKTTQLVSMDIKLTRETPIACSLRRVPLALEDSVHEELQALIKGNFVRTSTSPFASALVIVPKPNGTIRICVDFRPLNAVTVRDKFPIPLIEDLFDTLSGAVIFSSLDCFSGYWQIPISEKDKHKTAFITKWGLFEWNVMPMGLCNAPAVFQRLMNTIVTGDMKSFALAYIDDVIIFSKTLDEHLQHLDKVLQKFQDAGLSFKLSKCKFAFRQLKFLVHIVSTAGIKCDESKVAAVRNFPLPETVTAVRSFIGLVSYYRKFIYRFSWICSPLYNLLSMEKPLWSTQCQEAFNQLKEALCTAPILAFPQKGKEFIVYTDASKVGLSGILCQVQDGIEKVIEYASKKLTPTESRYHVTELECYAIFWSLGKFEHCLMGVRFQVVTDHKALRSLSSLQVSNDRLFRWSLKLQKFDFVVQYRPGKLNGNADALSRYVAEEIHSSQLLQCNSVKMHDYDPRVDPEDDPLLLGILRGEEVIFPSKGVEKISRNKAKLFEIQGGRIFRKASGKHTPRLYLQKKSEKRSYANIMK